MHPHDHAKSSVQAFGGKLEDYLPIHDFLDSSKSTFCSWQHRAILHNTLGCYIAERVFGSAIRNSDGNDVPVRVIAELHIVEDIGFVPTVQEWVGDLPITIEKTWRQGNPNMGPKKQREAEERRKILEKFQADLSGGVPASDGQSVMRSDEGVSQAAEVDSGIGTGGAECSGRSSG